MSSESAPRPASRFRTARVETPTSDVERLELLLDDGERLHERFVELASARARTGDIAGVLELARTAQRASDPHRAYQATRTAASLLVEASQLPDHAQELAWAAWHDAVVELLVPWLETSPHEPELLNLLGVSVYELGHTRSARRLFEAIRAIDPDNERARTNLRSCRDRMQRGTSVASVPEARTPHFAAMRSRIKRIADIATRLEARTVSVCMIVKDEEEMLPGCLAAVAPHVHQVVVVDTGSSDRTKEIAAEHGALVVDFAWNGSFSDARNESLRHATGDWILWLDADEHIVEGDAKLLDELARRTWIEGFQVIETHFTGDAALGGQASHTPMRLFQHRPEYSWRGTVHEQLLWAFPTWLPERFQQSSIRMDHYGYLASVVDSRGKHERNLSLLLEQVEHDRSTFTCFNIATEYGAIGDWSQANVWSEEALVLARESGAWHDSQFAPLMVQRAISARRGVGDFAGAIQLADEGLQSWPAYTDLIFEQATTHATTGDWPAAAERARAAMAQGDAPAKYVAAAGKGGYRARQILATALRELGDLHAAVDEYVQVLDEAPQFLDTVADLVGVLCILDGPDAASDRIDEILGARAMGAASSMLAGAAFHEAGAFAQAEERYARVLAARPGHPVALTARAELRLAQGRYRDAWDDALAVDADAMIAGSAARAAFLAAAVLEDADLLTAPLERITSAEELSVGERGVYRAWNELLAPTGIRSIVASDEAAANVVLGNLEALAKLEAADQFERLFPLLAQVLPDERARRMALADLYIRRRFPDLAGEELMACAERFGPEADVLTGLGTVATMKELWEDAEVLLQESLQLDPRQPRARVLLDQIQRRATA